MNNIILFLKNTGMCFLITVLVLSCSVDKEDLDTNNFDEISSSSSAAISSAKPSAGKTYFIKSVHSGKYIDVSGASTSNGAKIHQWSHTGATNQQWKIISNGSNYRIISVKSGKCLEVASNSTSNGGKIQQWKYVGSNSQKFTFSGSSSSGYEIKNVGSKKNVDVASYSTKNGGILHQWTDKSTANQKWEFIEVGSSSGSNFISTNDGSFQLNKFQIESSSHNSSSSDKSTDSWSYNDFSLASKWYNFSGGDYYLTSAKTDGKRTEWKESSGNESSLSSNEVIKYEASIDDIPEHGVTIAQMHNRGGVKRPFIRVYIENGKINVKETTNDLTKSSGTYTTAVGPSISEGSKFKVQLTTGSGKVNVKVETSSGTLNRDYTPYTGGNYSSYKNDFYFKAGVYTEGNDTEPTIRFYSFQKS